MGVSLVWQMAARWRSPLYLGNSRGILGPALCCGAVHAHSHLILAVTMQCGWDFIVPLYQWENCSLKKKKLFQRSQFKHGRTFQNKYLYLFLRQYCFQAFPKKPKKKKTQNCHSLFINKCFCLHSRIHCLSHIYFSPWKWSNHLALRLRQHRVG